jgi:hypothetical protein
MRAMERMRVAIGRWWIFYIKQVHHAYGLSTDQSATDKLAQSMNVYALPSAS